MVAVRLYLSGERADSVLQKRLGKAAQNVRTAARGAAQDALDYALAGAKADLSNQGRLGAKYLDGMQGKISEGGGNIRVAITNDVPGFDFLQEGGTVKGNPLMWIPVDNSGISAKDYDGRLFSVKRKDGGTPLLMDAGDRQVKYVGVETVEIARKFHTADIVEDAASRLPEFYKARFAALAVD